MPPPRLPMAADAAAQRPPAAYAAAPALPAADAAAQCTHPAISSRLLWVALLVRPSNVLLQIQVALPAYR